MKRAIVAVIILAATTIAGSTQYFVEGSIGVNYDYTEVTLVGYPTEKIESTFLFTFSPTLGYRLNDHIAVGVRLSLRRKITENLLVDPDDPDIRSYGEKTSPGWSFAVFGRYRIMELGKFSVLVESSAYTGKSSEKEMAWAVTKKISSRSEVGASLSPLVSYDFSDKFSIIATSSFLSLTLNSITVKNEETGHKVRYNHYGFNSSSTAFESLGGIKLGFVYNF